MAITKMSSYDLKGEKLSFADWISNISPTETPFCSMTGKEAISQTKFQWQSDVIPAVLDTNAWIEGSAPAFQDDIKSTMVTTNNTQIFRRAVSVSDTANVVAYYGRQKEVGYQMEKASLEMKRDMEKAFLWQAMGGGAKPENGGDMGTAASAGANTPHTAGFIGLVATAAAADKDTGAIVHKEIAVAVPGLGVTEAQLFDLTYQLYLANSKANIIMFHPKHAGFFSGLLSAPGAAVGNRMKMFDTMEDQYNTEVDTIVDPLGQKFALVPNRQMPENYFYFFNPSDWTQMVLRAPKKIQLAKVGSSEEWMIEAEVGLRHRNPFASGILKLKLN
ncbi:MAG: SU10 major capsid protein [Bacteroidales bacterium]